MRLAEELSKIVVGIIESAGHLKSAAREDPRLMADIEIAIAGRIKENRQQLVNFISFWGQRAHREHERVNMVSDWRKCQSKLCQSLYLSAEEIEKEIHETPAHANSAVS